MNIESSFRLSFGRTGQQPTQLAALHGFTAVSEAPKFINAPHE
jgi:hypothetical protein